MPEFHLDVLNDNGGVTNSFDLKGKLSVGRFSREAVPNIVIPAECRSASRAHATLEVQEDQVVLEDHSTHGTLIDGTLVHHSSVPVPSQAEIIFGQRENGWRVRFRCGEQDQKTDYVDPLKELVVTAVPRQIRIANLVVEERLGGVAFKLLEFLSSNRDQWFTISHLSDKFYPDPDKGPLNPDQAMARARSAINGLLRPYLQDQDAIEMRPHQGYRLKASLD